MCSRTAYRFVASTVTDRERPIGFPIGLSFCHGMNGWLVPPARVVFGLLLGIIVKLWNSQALGTQNMKLNMDRFLFYAPGTSVPSLGLDFSCVFELLALAIGHHFDVATAVSANEDTAAVGAESVTRGIRD